MKEEICKWIAKKLVNVSEQDVITVMEIPPEDHMGDFALPCFSFAKILHKNPAGIAQELNASLKEVQEELGIEKSEAVNGYLNIFMKRDKTWSTGLKKSIVLILGLKRLEQVKPSVWIILPLILQKIFMWDIYVLQSLAIPCTSSMKNWDFMLYASIIWAIGVPSLES